MRHLSIGRAAALLGAGVSTLRRSEREGRLLPAFRTPGGHRRYALNRVVEVAGHGQQTSDKRTVCYARVSGHDQNSDPARQAQRLKAFAEAGGYVRVEVIEDLGSGLNYRKRGLARLLHLLCTRQMERLVLTHKDRLLRFGSELVCLLCRVVGVEGVIIDEADELSFEQRLCGDALELMTVFAARLHGARSHRNRAAA